MEENEVTAQEMVDELKSQEPAAAESGQEEPTQAEAWDPQPWAYKFRGQIVYPKSKEEAIKLIQLGHRSRVRGSELEERQKQLDEMAKQYEKYGQLDKALQSNPTFQQRIWKMYEEAQQGGPPQEGASQDQLDIDAHPTVQGLRKQLEDLNSWKQQWEERTGDEDLEREGKALRDKYPDVDWDTDEGDGSYYRRVLEHSSKYGGVPLEMAHQNLSWDTHTVNTTAKAKKAAMEAKQKEKRAGVLDSGGKAPPEEAPDYRNLNYNQIAELALKDLEKGR